jgi:anti-sigma B factor antagonist
MHIDENIRGNEVHLTVSGNLDEATSSLFEQRLEEVLLKDQNEIFVDLSKVNYVSSIGIRALLIVHKKSLKAGKEIIITDMSEKVTEILNVVGIMPLFTPSGR